MNEIEEFAADEKIRIAALHKTAPENIWLQIDPEAEQFDWWDAQTWCSDQINDTDLEYVRADVVESPRQQLAAKQAEVDALMLEYCPSEMSQEQLDNWAAHQRPVEES